MASSGLLQVSVPTTVPGPTRPYSAGSWDLGAACHRQRGLALAGPPADRPATPHKFRRRRSNFVGVPPENGRRGEWGPRLRPPAPARAGGLSASPAGGGSRAGGGPAAALRLPPAVLAAVQHVPRGIGQARVQRRPVRSCNSGGAGSGGHRPARWEGRVARGRRRTGERNFCSKGTLLVGC